MRTPGIALVTLLAAGPVLAQDGTISQSYLSLVKPGMELKFEDGMKRHGQWHKAQKDPWTWNVWQIMAGDELGQYLTISGGHSWADFDKPGVDPAKDFQDATVNLLPFTQYTRSGFSRLLAESSRPWPDGQAPPMVQAIEFTLKPGGEAAFTHTIRKFTEAANKMSWPGRYLWIQRVAGGETPSFTLVLPLANFASMQATGTSPAELMESAWGRQDADALWEALNGAVASQRNVIWAHRPDLSYGPGGN